MYVHTCTPSMEKKVTNGGNRRWATCYNDSVATVREFTVPLSNTMATALPIGVHVHVATETHSHLFPSRLMQNEK